MSRIITVKGMGKVSAKPDLIILNMNLETKDIEYETTIKKAAKAINELQDSIVGSGFEKSDIKTTNFDVSPNFESVRDKKDNLKRVFRGYICTHNLKLEFRLDMKKMSEVFSALAKCAAEPEFSVTFSVQDKNSVSESLLIKATENAKAKAEILAKASGVTLEQIINIDYNWGELHLFSNTRYNALDSVMLSCNMSQSIDIEPEDIKVSDSVTFVWEII